MRYNDDKIKCLQGETVGHKDMMEGRLLIALAGLFWGTSGIFARFLLDGGVSVEWVSFLRIFIGAMVLTLITARRSPKLLRLDRRVIGLTAAAGLVSQAGFNICYYGAVERVGVGPAAVLLYTAPFFLLVWSALFFGERPTGLKVAAVCLCFAGCLIAVTEGNLAVFRVSFQGIAMGLLSALAYSLMSAISKVTLGRCAPVTVVIYSFFFGAAFLLPYAVVRGTLPSQLDPILLVWALGLGVIPAALSYRLYMEGIAKGVPLSEAGVISTLEMISAVLLAWAVFGESLSGVRLLGVAVILIGILLMNLPGKKRPRVDNLADL